MGAGASIGFAGAATIGAGVIFAGAVTTGLAAAAGLGASGFVGDFASTGAETTFLTAFFEPGLRPRFAGIFTGGLSAIELSRSIVLRCTIYLIRRIGKVYCAVQQN
jgi:hypothetical protein